jgi:hypothetical protein
LAFGEAVSIENVVVTVVVVRSDFEKYLVAEVDWVISCQYQGE